MIDLLLLLPFCFSLRVFSTYPCSAIIIQFIYIATKKFCDYLKKSESISHRSKFISMEFVNDMFDKPTCKLLRQKTVGVCSGFSLHCDIIMLINVVCMAFQFLFLSIELKICFLFSCC